MYANAAGATSAPIPPGRYCQLDSDNGTWLKDGKIIPVGNFLMSVEVAKRNGGYRVSFWNVLPDRPKDILGEKDVPASVERDGALVFRFTDVMGNRGRGRVWPNGKVQLSELHEASDNQLGRNYGDFRVTRKACAASDFSHRRDSDFSH